MASGSGWNLWVWLVVVVVRRYIDFHLSLLLLYLFFLQQHSYFLFIFKNVFFCIIFSGDAYIYIYIYSVEGIFSWNDAMYM